MDELKKYNGTEDVRAVKNIKLKTEHIARVIRAVKSS